MCDHCLLLGSLGCCADHNLEYCPLCVKSYLRLAGKFSDSVTRSVGTIEVGGGEKVFWGGLVMSHRNSEVRIG